MMYYVDGKEIIRRGMKHHKLRQWYLLCLLTKRKRVNYLRRLAYREQAEQEKAQAIIAQHTDIYRQSMG